MGASQERAAFFNATLLVVTYFWYFWLTIQNTTIPQVRNLFSVIAVFISFSGGTESMAVRPRTAWFLAALKYFLKKRKENKKRKKEKKNKRKKNKNKREKKASSAPCYIRRA